MLERASRHSMDEGLVIGILNNMPTKARRRTEQQFTSLLAAAAQGRKIETRFFSIPDTSCQSEDQSLLGGRYRDLAALWSDNIDGLIVTGAEPQAASMTDEPYWPALAQLVDWAKDRTFSTVWSCLAAHAAVLQLDGLVRRLLPEKLSGVFECVKVSNHCLISDAPQTWATPHSRFNGLDEDELLDNGYRVISRAPRVGADIFLKQANSSLFLMLHGHLEYDPESLLLEFRRDLRRFLAGQRSTYPNLPEGYFNEDATIELMRFREEALRRPRPELFSEFETISLGTLEHTWKEPAVRLYSQWLSYLVEQKAGAGFLQRADSRRRLLSS